MKNITILMVLFSSQLFSNYAFDTDTSGKIDMHGGKNDKLIDNTNRFSEMKMGNFKSLQGISIKNTMDDDTKRKVTEIKNKKYLNK